MNTLHLILAAVVFIAGAAFYLVKYLTSGARQVKQLNKQIERLEVEYETLKQTYAILARQNKADDISGLFSRLMRMREQILRLKRQRDALSSPKK